ncbi:MAG: GGDEF domain-containing protein [Spirochaeta sp.]|nr:GGDEF domain-containing protein [Spirochaeta sp.]
MHARLIEDLHLTIILIVTLLVCLFVLPLAVFRLSSGYYIVAVANFLVVGVTAAAAAWAWKTGTTYASGIIISVICTVGVLVSTFYRGIEGALWIFPLVMFVFFLSPPKTALALIATAIGAITIRELALPASIVESRIHLISFLATSLSTVAFSFVAARSTKNQNKQLMRLAAKDPLTGLKNRRGLEQELQFAMSAQQEIGAEYGLIIIDIDRFKQTNDDYGHSEGDRILREFAHLLINSLRMNDHAFRYGGDEFVVLIAGTNAAGLEAVCENILTRVRATIRVGERPLTVSIGAALQGPDTDTHSWFQRADKCVYRAKDAGRDRYIIGCKDET